jgi:hypothetical protein
MKDIYNENYKTLYEKSWRKQKMERPSVLIDWQNLYGDMAILPKQLQIQWNAHQNPNVILHRNRNINPKTQNIKDPK